MTDRVGYCVEPVFPPDDPRHALTTGPVGSPGRYRVTFILAVPGRDVVQDSIDFQAAVARGDSLLAVGTDVHTLRLDLWNYEDPGEVAIVGVNSNHRLRDLSVELEAGSFAAAGQLGYDLLTPVLSRWSFQHDVAITTSGHLMEELATGTVCFEATVLGAVKAFSDFEGVSTPEHRLLLSAYREGLSSAEPLWRALSLYKVAEGVWRLRAQRREAALAEGRRVNERSERIPKDVSALGHEQDHQALATALGPYAGKKFRAAFDDIRSTLRNSIAHLDPAADPLAQDTWSDIQRVQVQLPGIRWMSRQLLAAELEEAPEQSG